MRLVRSVKARYPDFRLHALSPPEVIHLSRMARIGVPQVIERLIAAGLDSIPGGGAEILVDRVRKILNCFGKASADEWLDVMGRSYGWSDPRAIEAWRELYRAAFDDREPPWWHVLVRDRGKAVACASLFPAGDLGFVTNVGTVPESRGVGHGTAATLAVLAIARRKGFHRASLTASLMGRSVYARIGFREDARLERFVSGAR